MTNAYDFFPHGDSRHYWYGRTKQGLESSSTDRRYKTFFFWKGGIKEENKNGRVDIYKNGRVDTHKNERVDTHKKGRVDTYKNGRVDTHENGRVDTILKSF